MRDPDDDLDLLFARTSPAPPPELTERTLRRLAVARRSGRLVLALVADALVLPALAVVAVLFGRELAASGAHELLLLGLEDRAIVASHPGEFSAALMQSLPWPYLLALALSVLALVLLTGYLLHATDGPIEPETRR